MARLAQTYRGRGGIITDSIGPTLDFMMATQANRVWEAMELGAQELQAYAQENAPWADRTGDARNGLHAEVDLEGGEVVISLMHTVDYGLYLELIQEGRFAIIMPTLEAKGEEVLQRAGAQVMEVP